MRRLKKGSRYADMLKKQSSESVTIDDERTIWYKPTDERLRPRNVVVNYIPPNRDSSYDAWQYAYYRHLIDLRNIFIEKMYNVVTTEQFDYYKSPEFFVKFCFMIYKNSSKYIPSDIDKLCPQDEKEYFEFFGK
jgi:hypothetical protein